jgi:hypothetical protein
MKALLYLDGVSVCGDFAGDTPPDNFQTVVNERKQLRKTLVATVQVSNNTRLPGMCTGESRQTRRLRRAHGPAGHPRIISYFHYFIPYYVSQF